MHYNLKPDSSCQGYAMGRCGLSIDFGRSSSQAHSVGE